MRSPYPLPGPCHVSRVETKTQRQGPFSYVHSETVISWSAKVSMFSYPNQHATLLFHVRLNLRGHSATDLNFTPTSHLLLLLNHVCGCFFCEPKKHRHFSLIKS